MSEATISYRDYCFQGATFRAQCIKATQGVELNVVTFSPPVCGPMPLPLPSIIFLPGLGSVIDNFRETLIALTAAYKVYYLETREKGSSKTGRDAKYSIEAIASDLPVITEKLGLKADEYIILGYSLGATVAVASFKLLSKKPVALVLTEPSATFLWPWWLPPLARVGVPLYPILKPFIKWYMKKFHINEEGDFEMYEINSRILDQADPRKLAATVVAVAKYKIWDDIRTVDVPTLVIGVSHDRFHSHDEASNIAAAIPGSSYTDVETNKRSHSAEVAGIVDNFLETRGL